MTQHVADRILTALETQLATVTGIGASHVFFQPLTTLTDPDLPALIVDDIVDEVVERTGFFPVDEKHEMRFSVFACDLISRASFRSQIGTLRHDTELATVGTVAARTLNSLLTRGLQRGDAAYEVDSESLQKPVGGWRIPYKCTYFLSSDRPGNVEKE